MRALTNIAVTPVWLTATLALLVTSLLIPRLHGYAAIVDAPSLWGPGTMDSGEISREDGVRSKGRHLNADDRIRDLLNHPALAGFAPLILPWDDRTYDEDMRLSNLNALLPYHSHVHPETVVSALNRMIDDVSGGKPVFYNFYTDAQKQEEPTKRNTGLFFFRGKLAGTLCRDMPWRRVFLRRLRPRRFSVRRGD